MASVTILDQIHTAYPNLPAAISRIPPRQNVEVRVLVTNLPYPAASQDTPVLLEVMDANSLASGFATISGQAQLKLYRAQTHRIKICAQRQTEGGRKVVLIARQQGKELARSNEFFICAYPRNFTVRRARFGHSNRTRGKYGLAVIHELESDSGEVGDLSGVQVTEKVEYSNGVGSLANPDAIHSGYRDARLPSPDFHSISRFKVASLDNSLKAGSLIANQMFLFKCTRSRVGLVASGIPVFRSGFRITKKAEIFDQVTNALIQQQQSKGNGNHCIRLTVEKTAQNVTIGSQSTDAGFLQAAAVQSHDLNTPVLAP